MSQKFPPNLQYVAILLYEGRKSKKCYQIFMLNVTINMFN